MRPPVFWRPLTLLLLLAASGFSKIEAATNGPLSHVLRYNTAPIVSRDIVGDPSSCVFDSGLTMADGELVKVFGWYDNEFGYTSRLADLVEYVAERL